MAIKQAVLVATNRTNRPPEACRPALRPIAAGICACLALGGGAAQAQTQGNEGLEEVFITGSRIVRRDFDAPSPILTVDTELFQQNSSVAIEAVLNQYPQFNPGATQFTTGEIQPTATTSPGASTLNMRGLGANRSLVLLDGRRAQPVNAAMTVDVNTIPAAAIADVEVISGGAAATYGPDAMAGVVNFKLRRDFEGVDINYQTGTTDVGDGEESRFDVLMGGNFDENRGNAMFSIGYANREAAWQMSRDFFVDGFNDPGTPANYPRIDYPYFTPVSTNLPSQAATNQVLGTTANQSRTVDFYVNPLDGTVFRQQNALGYTGPTTFPYKIRAHNGSLEEGSPRSYASTPLTRYSAFGRTTYELTEGLSAFAQGTFVMTEVKTVLFPTPLTGAAVPHGDRIYAPSVDASGNTLAAYRPGGAHGLNCPPTGGCSVSQVWPVPAELQVLLDSRPNREADWTMSRIAYWYPNRASDNETKLSEFIVGLEGTIGDSDWTWEGYTSFGETILLTHMTNFVWIDRYRMLVQQPNYGRGGGFEAMAANSTNTQDFTCTTGLPIFEPWILGSHGEALYYNDFQISNDCLDAVTARMSQRNVVEQRVTEVNFQGKLADLRAGELRGAFGLSTRLNESLFEPDALFLATVPASGDTNVDEIYGEILLPVVGELELELGGRYSDFTTGDFQLDAKSYKALFNWGATDSFRFRGGWQRANRTPNVAELYSGPTGQVYTWAAGDACRADTTHPWGNLPSNPNRAQVQQLCAELIYKEGGIPGQNRFDAGRDNFPIDGGESANVYRLLTKGNPRLRAETADTYTLGMIWQPQERGISLTADLYQIEIDDVVDSLGFLTAYQQCFNVNGVSNPTYSVSNEFCQAIHRAPDTGNAGYVEGGNFNLSKRFTSGLDVSLNWTTDMAGGQFGINSSINKLFSWKQPASADPDSPLLEYAGSAGGGANSYYDYRLFTQFTYDRDKFRIGLNWRYLPSAMHDSKVLTPTLTVLDTEDYHLFNLNGSWQFNERMRLRGGIDNLVDEDPVIVGANPLNLNNPTNGMGNTSAGNYDTLGRRYYVGLAVTF
jgi:outer membrane receptor protein involved in Fe transport